jgi:C_GCAxxG_C_C family probable redox protein
LTRSRLKLSDDLSKAALIPPRAASGPDSPPVPLPSPLEDAAVRVGRRARAFFESRRWLCSEAVLIALGEELEGGLSESLATRLACGLPMGLGGEGCLCGALSGGVLGLGLFLTPDHPSLGDRRRVREASAELHRRFRDEFGAPCCRVLTKKVKKDSAAHLGQCARLTETTAVQAARLILAVRPDLLRSPTGFTPPPPLWRRLWSPFRRPFSG